MAIVRPDTDPKSPKGAAFSFEKWKLLVKRKPKQGKLDKCEAIKIALKKLNDENQVLPSINNNKKNLRARNRSNNILGDISNRIKMEEQRDTQNKNIHYENTQEHRVDTHKLQQESTLPSIIHIPQVSSSDSSFDIKDEVRMSADQNENKNEILIVEEGSETTKEYNHEQPGHRLYRKASEIATKLERKRQEATVLNSDDASEQELFRPRLISKQLVKKSDTELSKGTVFKRLYKDAKMKKMRELARKRTIDLEVKSRVKRTFISPKEATGLYERSVVKRDDVRRKLEGIAASMTPSFRPTLFSTNNRRMHTRSDETKKRCNERLYNTNYIRQRDEKLQKVKEAIEAAQCTFTPLINPDREPNTSALNRLYERRQKKTALQVDSECTFMPDISLSQKHYTAGRINPDGTRMSHSPAHKATEAPSISEETSTKNISLSEGSSQNNYFVSEETTEVIHNSLSDDERSQSHHSVSFELKPEVQTTTDIYLKANVIAVDEPEEENFHYEKEDLVKEFPVSSHLVETDDEDNVEYQKDKEEEVSPNEVSREEFEMF